MVLSARLTRAALAITLVSGVSSAACGASTTLPRAADPAPHAAASCARRVAGASKIVPLALPRTGSTVALATRGGRTLAYAVDEDDATVHVVDVDAKKELGATPLDGRPSQLLLLADGRLVVLLRDKSRAQVFEAGVAPGQLAPCCTVETASEPVGLAVTPDDSTLLVTSGWGRAIAGFDTAAMAKTFEVSLPREPRAVVVSDDGKFAYVSHAVGARASRLDLASKSVTDVSLHGTDSGRDAALKDLRAELASLRETKRPIPDDVMEKRKELEASQPSCQGYALAKSIDPGGRILAPQVLVDTGDPRERAPGYGNDNGPTEVPDVAVIDEKTGQTISASLEHPGDAAFWGEDPREPKKPECLLPRAAVVDPARKSLLVSCFGIDAVVEYDALAASPARAERMRWSVGAGPSGIAIDPAKNRAVVWAQFDHELSVIDLGAGELVDDRGRPPAPAPRIAMARRMPSLPPTVALGRQLFHAVGDARISKDGRACASCHPDGRDDSLVWATPDGPRRSIMLAGRVLSTAPYSWAGDEADLRVHLASTFDRLNGAGGLKSVELDALTAYIESLAPPPPLAPAHDAKIERGAALFASKEVGCAGCHAGPAGSDNAVHDVASKATIDRVARFNTPTLRFVSGTGPYFHDGRYATLHELLTANLDTMGHTKQLSADDLDALEAYLRTL
jgi:DNA-binding beta-propeller fold protein YncE/mono/diheme cytochrome c family protein